MEVLSVMSQKGGAGKTTLVVHLAVAAVRSGLKVAVLDADPQGSAMDWAQARQSDDVLVVKVSARKLSTEILNAHDAGFDLVIVDTAPNAGPDSVDVAKLSTKILIPVRPSSFDLSAVKRTVDVVFEAKKTAWFVLSACPLRAPEISKAREALAWYEIPVTATEIGDRRAFSRAVQTGRAVLEFEPRGKAAAEINALLEEIMK